MTANRLAEPRLVEKMAMLMRLFGDPTRIRLVGLLVDGEQNVSALCGELNVAQPPVSHHLALLRNAGLVVKRRAGKQIYYSLNSRHIPTRDVSDGLHVSYGHVRMCLGCREESPTPRTAPALS